MPLSPHDARFARNIVRDFHASDDRHISRGGSGFTYGEHNIHGWVNGRLTAKEIEELRKNVHNGPLTGGLPPDPLHSFMRFMDALRPTTTNDSK